MQPADDWIPELHEVEDSATALDKPDYEELKKEKVRTEGRRNAFVECCASFRLKKKDVSPAARGKGRRGVVRDSLRLQENGRIAQADAKRYLPPGASLWKSRWQQVWLSRVPPLKSVSRAWQRYTEEGALFLVVKAAWQQYCTLEGLDASTCLMGNVFTADPQMPGGDDE